MKAIIQVITDKEMVDKVRKAAKEDKRSISTYCLIAIEEKIDKQGK